jgi:hypothetical protein
MKKTKILLALSFVTAFGFMAQAGKTGGSGGTTLTTAFSFTYNVGTVTNYHAYGVAAQVGYLKTQPAGTITLENFWVWDLGPVHGSGTVNCPKPVVATGGTAGVLGILLFANASDVGGQAIKCPVVDVQIFTPKLYNGYASLVCAPPIDNDKDDSGITIYWGPPNKPFSRDISAYVWNVEPATGW